MKRKTGIFILTAALVLGLLAGCAPASPGGAPEADGLAGLTLIERVPLTYAEQFTIDRYAGGYSLITLANGSRYCVVPEGAEAPEGLEDEGIAVIRQPVGTLYVAASAVMGLFDCLDSMDAVAFTSTKEDSWYIDAPRQALQAGTLRYVGKYSDPDYELLLASGCTLAVESTMIEHAPEVREKLEELGILVFEDFSSYESHPLGRSEWVKVYGEILGKADAAQALFEEQRAYFADASDGARTGKTVAFFYINSAGQVVTRRSGDYVTKMIALAGGENAFESLDGTDGASSSVTMEMEQFYAEAKDADIIIYNNTISGGVDSIDGLVAQNSLLGDCKAVKNGDVWCTRHNFYQETLQLGAMVYEMHTVFTAPDTAEDLQFLYRLQRSAP